MNSADTAKTYVITGGATGIGAAVRQQLEGRGDRVIVVDIKNADVTADLSTVDGAQQAIAGVEQKAVAGLDGLIVCAGLGPHITPISTITRVNFFGAVRLTEGLKPLLQKKQGSAVLVSSNSASLPGRHEDYVQALLDNDESRACEIISGLDGHSAYAGSKYALAVWMRKQAPAYMADGVRMNAVAPGVTRTAMTDGVFADDALGDAIKQFSEMTPHGEIATPDMIANTIVFLMDPASRYVCGSVLFVDGGTDALLRPESF